MSRKKFTEQEDKLLRDNYLKMSNPELAELLGRPYHSIKSRLRTLKLERPAEIQNKFKHEHSWPQQIRWSKKEIKYVKNNFRTMGFKTIAKNLGMSESRVRTLCRRMGFVRTPEEHQKMVNVSRFKKGHTPNNKGCHHPNNKGSHHPNSIRHQYPKGRKPQNELYDGAITIRTNYKTKVKYKYIRISKNKWRLYQQVVWEENFGPIPKGKILWFKDRDTLNVLPENLELITRKEQVRRNQNVYTDKFVANLISRDPAIKRELLKHPEMLEVKRQQMKLNKEIKNALGKKTGKNGRKRISA